MSDTRTDTALAGLSHRIAAELDTAADVCRRVEDLAAALAAETGASLADLSSLQALDELTQRLSNLAGVLSGIGDQADPAWTIEMAPLMAKVRLGDLAQRLSGEAKSHDADAGEADFF